LEVWLTIFLNLDVYLIHVNGDISK
jgi:hypothetical protein